MKTLPAILLAALLLAAPCRPGAQDAPARAAAAEDAAQVRDKLSISLFFRGELADKIIEAGMADRFVSLEGVETHAGARSLLLDWIRRNPDKAAGVYLGLKGAGGRIHEGIETRQMTWKFNPAFIASIKALNAAAGSASVSREAMELAARRLYDGPQAEAGAAVELGGGAGRGGGTNFFSGSYADYRLNRAGLELETARAADWLEGVKPPGPGSPAAGAYAAAFALYREFLVAASALKGREAMTGAESLRLEDLRIRLRSALAALTFSARAAALREAAASLEPFRAEPGAAQLAAALRALAGELEASAGAAGGADLRALAAAVNGGERDFASLYLAYTAYDGLLSLKRRAEPGYSCLLDFGAYRYLAAYFPASAYPAARARLAAAGRLDAALDGIGTGDLEGALAGLDPAALEAAAGAAAAASALNRASQFFSWGLLFRPVELKVLPGPRGPVFRPAFTFFELRGR